MTERIRDWLNSVQAHMIGFAGAVIILLTVLSAGIVILASPPQLSPITIYDISRVIRGVPPAQQNLPKEFTRHKSADARFPASDVERRLSGFLAEDLGLSPDRVRIYLGNRSPTYLSYLERQAAYYSQGHRGSPVIYGTVVVGVRRADGAWDVHVRRSKNGFENVWDWLRASPWLGFLIILPFATWFSTKIARPVRAFAQAASQVGGGKEFLVPVAGPTEIRVAAKALNEMQARIRTFGRQRSALVGAIAHDLRTPLNSLRFRVAQAPDEVRIPAENDIKQLDRMIASILEYAENEARPLAIEPIDLLSLLQSMVDDRQDQGVNITINFDVGSATIEGDLLMLRRLFANLIDNAVKFASSVWVTLRSTPSQAVVTITDDGPGMTPSDQAQAFEPFFRGEPSRNRTTGGIGLGLAIAKAAVAAHGGDISLANRPSGGLQVDIVLPLRQTPP